MKNVHLLQTETYPAKLQLDRDYGTLTILDEPCVINGQDFVGANLYITSNELYTVGWYLDNNNHITKTITDQKSYWEHKQNWKKIILTTDPRLIKDGVQALDDEFLNWFIKNQKREIPIITTIVNNESHYTTNIGFKVPKIKEPKQDLEKEMFELEEQLDIPSHLRWHNSKPKQETLEEFINSQPYYGSCTTEYLEGIEVGAKWQQERSYSEEEVKSILQFFIKDTRGDKPWIDADDEWFEQFKKSSDGNK